MTGDELMYRLGYNQGFEIGYGRAENDMAREWSAVAKHVRNTSRKPTSAELAERRKPGGAIYEAALCRRGGREYEGGPVNFWTGQPGITRESA